jgi:hypothetical protein
MGVTDRSINLHAALVAPKKSFAYAMMKLAQSVSF